MSDSTKRHALRKQLIANGYRPLPLLDKGIRIKGWSTAVIDDEWLEPFARSGRYQNTGIRCDDLIAFDIDVYDEALADEIEENIEHFCGPTEFCRVGRWPKRLLLYRVDGEAIRSARTGKYNDHQVELLASSGRQFAAFGIHPGTGEPYEWESRNPRDDAIDRVPALKPEIAQQMMQAIEVIFESHGLERGSPGNTIGSTGHMAYDLTDDTLFQIGGEAITWAALKPQLTEAGLWCNLMRENGHYGDSEGVHAFLAKGTGTPTVHDFPRDTTHQDAFKAVQLPVLPPTVLFNTPDTRTPLEIMRDTWVLLHDQTARMIDEPAAEFTIAGLRTASKHEFDTVINRQGNPVEKPLLDLWLGDRKTKRAHVAQLRPDHPDEKLFQAGRLVVFNTYRRPEHPIEGGEIDTVMEFIEHLIPDERERELFLDWHAVKVLHPSYRLHGLIMVTETQGTGRNTWLKILRRLLGQQYVSDTTFKQLVGQTGGAQAEYNDYFADSLVVFASEALEDADQGKWRRRHSAFEGLKQVIDTSETRMHIKRKRVNNTIQDVFASVIIASNHLDMLAIEPGDRRLIVLSNGITKLDDVGTLADRIHKWIENPANIGRLYRWLIQRAIDGVQYEPHSGSPISTPAKQFMIDLSRNDIDEFYDMLVDRAAGDIVTEHQFMALVGQYYLTSGLALPDQLNHGKKAIKSIFHRLARRPDEVHQLYFGKHRVRPWIIRNFDQWHNSRDVRKMKAEIERNGLPGGSVVSFSDPDDS